MKEIPCSTGLEQTPTKEGLFRIYKKKLSSVVKEGTVHYYFITLFNGYCSFHSTLFGDHPMVEEGRKLFEKRLPSSSGCVRLQIQDAEWIYENVPIGTTVWIH